MKLNNGVDIPQIGLGTYAIPNDCLTRIIGKAYDLGYRQFDTAWSYGNEKAIAFALKENGIRRSDVFITTKVNADALYLFGYYYGKRKLLNIRNVKSIEKAVLESFDNLHTEYIDLFLVHWPWPIFLDMYEVLTKLYKEGRIRAIGVSSFLPPHLEALKKVSDVMPAVNQFEISPLNTQKQLIKYCQDRGIAVEAMATFSHYRSTKPRKEITENPIIRTIAERKGKSIVQVVLRWLLQQNVIIIPKTSVEEHLQENINILDFELTLDEIKIINSLDQGKFLNYNPYNVLHTLPKSLDTWRGFV